MLNNLGSGDLHRCCGKSLAIRGWGLACPLAAPTIRVGINLSSVHGTRPNTDDEIEEAVFGLIWWGRAGVEEQGGFGTTPLRWMCVIWLMFVVCLY